MFKRLKDAVSFKKNHLEKIAKHYNVSINGLNHFTLDPNDPALNDDEPDNNPLLFRPIVKNGEDEFIFVLPTVTVNCLNHFIRNQAIQKGCLTELMKLFYDHQWNATKTLLLETGWRETDIVLPITALKVKESVFRFDNEKLGYVCLIMVGSSQPSTEKKEANIEQEDHTISPIENRNKEVIHFLEELNGATPYKYFTLNILGESGQDAYFMYGKPQRDNQILTLKYGELEKMVFSGELDILTLWKFAKVYNQSRLQTRLFSMGGVLDAFVAYQSNNGSLLPTETAIPDFIHFPIGSSDDFGRKSIIKVDEHSALQNTEQYGLLSIPVRRMRDFAPIYKEREHSKAHNLLLECFQCPVWVKNNQAKSKRDSEMINHYSESIIFWLYNMRHELHPFFNQFKNIDPVEFELILPQELINPPEKSPKTIEENNVLIEFGASKQSNCITIKLPTEILGSFFRPDNLGEKELMKATLSGFSDLLELKAYNVLDKKIIPALIDKYLSPESAKMILYFDTTNELRLDDRGLPPFRSIQESEISLILDNLVSYLNLKKPIPEKIESRKDKNTFCNKIVSALVSKLISELEEYNAGELLIWLMKMYEKCIQSREFKEIHIPAKISCFSDFPSEVQKLEKDNNALVATALSIRCVIEFIAAKPKFGIKWPNFDDYDRLLALMDQVISWGMLSDTIDLGMDDPAMGLLPSGRIGTDKSFGESFLKPFSQVKAEANVYDYQQKFSEKYKMLTNSEIDKPEPTEEITEINLAFNEEWGIGLTEILKIKRSLVEIAFEKQQSVVEMEEQQLETELSQKHTELDEGKKKIGLNLLSLTERESIDKSPPAFDKSDIYPWKYNRELSYLRKPLIKIQQADGRIMYYWSYRHVLDSFENLLVLLFNGRLKAKEGGPLGDYLNKINKEKGKGFRDEVVQWLLKEGSLEVITYEVKPEKLSGKAEDGKYGDIDILAIDKTRKIIFSIECKNTVSARVIHEFKTEMDKYLGRNGNDGMIIKHVERDKWLKSNIGLMDKFVTNPEAYSVNSLLVTSEDLPITYLAQESLPLPIISFPTIKRKGVNSLIV